MGVSSAPTRVFIDSNLDKKTRNWFCIEVTLCDISLMDDVNSEDSPRDLVPFEDFEVLLEAVEPPGDWGFARLLVYVFVFFDVFVVAFVAVLAIDASLFE